MTLVLDPSRLEKAAKDIRAGGYPCSRVIALLPPIDTGDDEHLEVLYLSPTGAMRAEMRFDAPLRIFIGW